ncbi:MAG: hypothetical protein HFI48_16585 [Lachnospiraceae bacterium]|nr:hypothetical protein [Lachnospiraceae bacterium]
MGVMIRVSCGSCKADWQCRTGCGMMHGNLENAAASYPAEIRKEIYANVQGEYPLFDFSYQPARCMYCRGIVSVPVLEAEDGKYRYTGVCEVCGGEVETIQDLSQTSCPVCGKMSLKEEEIGLWD